MLKAHFILYVTDQARSTAFYAQVLALSPTLNMPGMTEFTLADQCILGLMPEASIKRLLGNKLPDPAQDTLRLAAVLGSLKAMPAGYQKDFQENNATLFAAGPAIDASGNLSYTPAADANGVAHLSVKITDDSPPTSQQRASGSYRRRYRANTLSSSC